MNELQVYKCTICGTVVEMLNGATTNLNCCGQNMVELKANTTDAAVEKHVPAIETSGEEIVARVGEVSHPMDEDHYSMWIALVYDNTEIKVSLKPGEVPEAKFPYVPGSVVYAYCNKHGLWKAEVK